VTARVPSQPKRISKMSNRNTPRKDKGRASQAREEICKV
jgi:hypothetical protein